MKREKKERNKKLHKLRKEDPEKWTFQKLGDEFGISNKRAFIIFKKLEEEEGFNA